MSEGWRGRAVAALSTLHWTERSGAELLLHVGLGEVPEDARLVGELEEPLALLLLGLRRGARGRVKPLLHTIRTAWLHGTTEHDLL